MGPARRAALLKLITRSTNEFVIGKAKERKKWSHRQDHRNDSEK
jgi:hypothetical protein